MQQLLEKIGEVIAECEEASTRLNRSADKLDQVQELLDGARADLVELFELPDTPTDNIIKSKKKFKKVKGKKRGKRTVADDLNAAPIMKKGETRTCMLCNQKKGVTGYRRGSYICTKCEKDAEQKATLAGA